MPEGYALSARAAEAEYRWQSERKGIVPLSGYLGDVAQANRDDFSTNRVTVRDFRDGLAAGRGNAEGLAAAGACVSFWSGNIAGLPLHVTRKGPSGVDVPAPDHPLYWLLHDSPNYDQSAFDFWEYMNDAIEWHGNAYARMEKRQGGFITSLTPVDPGIVRAARRGDGVIEYRWDADGTKNIVEQGDMLHIRGRGGDALGGVSTLGRYRQAFQSAIATEGSSSTIFSNGVRASGVLGTDKQLTPDQRDDLEGKLQNKFVGAQNAGRPMLLDNGLKWTPLSITPVDAEMIEARQLGMIVICQIFEVDPHLVGLTFGNTTLGSSITTQTLSLMRFKMHKRLKRIEGALEKQLLSRADRQQGISIKFNIEGFLRADSEGRSKFYQVMAQIGAMTINEIRALEGLPPVAGGEVPRMQMQNQPITAAPGISDNSGPPLETNK
jgi:HK97 family phage portal protein